VFRQKSLISLLIGLLLLITLQPLKARLFMVDISSVRSTTPITVNVVDLTGRIQYCQTVVQGITHISIPTTRFHRGLYLVTVETNNSKVIEKVVVE
jgi:hypothetical protein